MTHHFTQQQQQQVHSDNPFYSATLASSQPMRATSASPKDSPVSRTRSPAAIMGDGDSPRSPRASVHTLGAVLVGGAGAGGGGSSNSINTVPSTGSGPASKSGNPITSTATLTVGPGAVGGRAVSPGVRAQSPLRPLADADREASTSVRTLSSTDSPLSLGRASSPSRGTSVADTVVGVIAHTLSDTRARSPPQAGSGAGVGIGSRARSPPQTGSAPHPLAFDRTNERSSKADVYATTITAARVPSPSPPQLTRTLSPVRTTAAREIASDAHAPAHPAAPAVSAAGRSLSPGRVAAAAVGKDSPPRKENPVINFGNFLNISPWRTGFNREADCRVALLPENASLNRYKDILPYDDQRIHLARGEHEYINASPVRVALPAGHVAQYIACQAPKENTSGDFWAMVWEHNVNVVCMLTSLVEAGRNKSCCYWPGHVGDETDYDAFRVTLESEEIEGCVIYRKLSLCDLHNTRAAARAVHHIQYTGWPDTGVPTDGRDFLFTLETAQQAKRHTRATGPVVVHCSAGIGRTGVFITLEVALALLQEGRDVDLPSLLEAMRTQRIGLVQTEAQYTFVCALLSAVQQRGGPQFPLVFA